MNGIPLSRLLNRLDADRRDVRRHWLPASDEIVERVEKKVRKDLGKVQQPRRQLLGKVKKIGDLDFKEKETVQKVDGYHNRNRFIVGSQVRMLQKIEGKEKEGEV